MKKWIILAGVAALLSSCIHFYLTKRSYDLATGQAQESVVCNINEKINCDSALLSPYAKVFNIPLSNFGVGFNLSLGLFLLFLLWGFFQTSYWRTISVYLSGFIALISLVMIFVSFLEQLYCPLCWTTYFLSFISFLSLAWIFRKDVSQIPFKDLIFNFFKQKHFLFLGGSIFLISFFLHMIFVVNYGIKDNSKQFQAFFMDWKFEESFRFSKPPVLKSGPESSSITLVEFADFMCPNCKQVQPSLKQFLELHPDVSFHFYLFPLDKTCNKKIHHQGSGTTCILSRATICGSKQNLGWNVHELIFKNQREFLKNQGNKKRINELLKNIIQASGLNSKKFFACMRDPRTHRALEEMAQMGSQVEIPGTPTFFINGKLLNRSSNNVLPLLNYIYDRIR